MMKRRFRAKCLAFVMSAVLMSGCMTAAGDTAGKDQISLYDRGLYLVEKMDMMAESWAYGNMLTSSEEMLAVIKEIGDQDYSVPRAVYQIKLSGTMDFLISLLDERSAYDELQEDLKKDLEDRLASSIASRFNAMAGVQTLGTVNLIAASDHFIDASLTETLTYLYIYDGGYGAAVTFLPCKEGIVHASGMMIKTDILDQGSDGEEILWKFLEIGGIQEEAIEKVFPQN